MHTDNEATLRRVCLADDLGSIPDAWRTCNREFTNDTVHFGDPEWLTECFSSDKASLQAFLLERGGGVVGVAPFLTATIPVTLGLGGIAFGAMPLRGLRLLGGCPNLPADRSVYDQLFRELASARQRHDAIWMECLRVDSFLWRYLHDSSIVRENFYLHCARGPTARYVVRPVGSFELYMRKFSASGRWHRLKEMKRLRAKGEVELVRCLGPDQVEAFVESAADLSRKTYQFRRLGLGLRDVESVKRKLRLAAERGWLRSYLLTCGGNACCFLVGYQHHGRFYYAEIGYDPAWSQFSVGRITILLALQDLLERDTPETIDFGEGGGYKEYLANDSYVEADVLLFGRRAYPLLAAALRRACEFTSRGVLALVEGLGLKKPLKRLLRRGAVAGP
jgi:hypothetical protein